MGMPGARFSRDHVSRGHGAPMHTVSRRTQPVNRNIHHAQPTVTHGEKSRGRRCQGSEKSPACD